MGADKKYYLKLFICMHPEFLETLQNEQGTEMDAEVNIAATTVYKTYMANLFSSYTALIDKN